MTLEDELKTVGRCMKDIVGGIQGVNASLAALAKSTGSQNIGSGGLTNAHGLVVQQHGGMDMDTGRCRKDSDGGADDQRAIYLRKQQLANGRDGYCQSFQKQGNLYATRLSNKDQEQATPLMGRDMRTMKDRLKAQRVADAHKSQEELCDTDSPRQKLLKADKEHHLRLASSSVSLEDADMLRKGMRGLEDSSTTGKQRPAANACQGTESKRDSHTRMAAKGIDVQGERYVAEGETDSQKKRLGSLEDSVTGTSQRITVPSKVFRAEQDARRTITAQASRERKGQVITQYEVKALPESERYPQRSPMAFGEQQVVMSNQVTGAEQLIHDRTTRYEVSPLQQKDKNVQTQPIRANLRSRAGRNIISNEVKPLRKERYELDTHVGQVGGTCAPEIQLVRNSVQGTVVEPPHLAEQQFQAKAGQLSQDRKATNARILVARTPVFEKLVGGHVDMLEQRDTSVHREEVVKLSEGIEKAGHLHRRVGERSGVRSDAERIEIADLKQQLEDTHRHHKQELADLKAKYAADLEAINQRLHTVKQRLRRGLEEGSTAFQTQMLAILAESSCTAESQLPPSATQAVTPVKEIRNRQTQYTTSSKSKRSAASLEMSSKRIRTDSLELPYYLPSISPATSGIASSAGEYNDGRVLTGNEIVDLSSERGGVNIQSRPRSEKIVQDSIEGGESSGSPGRGVGVGEGRISVYEQARRNAASIWDMMLPAWNISRAEEGIMRDWLYVAFSKGRPLEDVIASIDRHVVGPMIAPRPFPPPCLVGHLARQAKGTGGTAMLRCPHCTHFGNERICCWAEWAPGVASSYGPRVGGRIAREDYWCNKDVSPWTVSLGSKNVRWILRRRKETHDEPDVVDFWVNGIKV